jgi:thiamine-phosphate pyrophosphorylase
MVRYAITDRARFSGDESAREAALLQQARSLAGVRVDFLQLREKDLGAAALVTLARKLLETLRAHTPTPKLLINSRADVAVAAQADGVHITSEFGSLSPANVRDLYASASLPEPIVSVSCHTLAEVAHARDAGASLILFGPVFEKVVVDESAVGGITTQPIDALISEGIGLNLLHIACSAAAPTPVLALGGITPENTAACLAAGAAGIAAIRLFSFAR